MAYSKNARDGHLASEYRVAETEAAGARFGDRLRRERLSRSMTLQELADKVGVARATINRYETGTICNPPFSMVKKLAGALGVTENLLLGLPDGENPAPSEEDLPTSKEDFEIMLIGKNRNRLTEEQKLDLLKMVKYFYPELFIMDKQDEETERE